MKLGGLIYTSLPPHWRSPLLQFLQVHLPICFRLTTPSSTKPTQPFQQIQARGLVQSGRGAGGQQQGAVLLSCCSPSFPPSCWAPCSVSVVHALEHVFLVCACGWILPVVILQSLCHLEWALYQHFAPPESKGTTEDPSCLSLLGRCCW